MLQRLRREQRLGIEKPHFFKLDGHWCFKLENPRPEEIGTLRRYVRELRANDIPPGHISTEYGDT